MKGNQRIFKNLQEIENNAGEASKRALERTLNDLEDVFYQTVQEDVYNVYKPKFYDRTYWLLSKNKIKKYVRYTSTKNSFSGIINLDNLYKYPISLENFQHANNFEEFDSDDFIKMLNNEIMPSWNNPYNFPVVYRPRGFLEHFEENVNSLYRTYFVTHFENITGVKLYKESDSQVKKVQSENKKVEQQSKGVTVKKVINTNAKTYGKTFTPTRQQSYHPDISDAGAYGSDMYI